LDSIPEDQPLTSREGADLLDISYNLFNAKVRAGEIGYVEHNGRERRFYPRHLREYLESKAVQPKPTTKTTRHGTPPVSKKRGSGNKEQSKADWRRAMKEW